jgi:hypothetical protein
MRSRPCGLPGGRQGDWPFLLGPGKLENRQGRVSRVLGENLVGSSRGSHGLLGADG